MTMEFTTNLPINFNFIFQNDHVLFTESHLSQGSNGKILHSLRSTCNYYGSVTALKSACDSLLNDLRHFAVSHMMKINYCLVLH